ncbi:hypothetical protein [Abyssisolibacter fermentans]|uniref:hypothetical protein n=1 Tax=Abyssisolibacter fermentans TaxID=1766203 RepID=UPI00082BAF4C|nr:hypothetical protein [Abyssisolibacter fermentans]
MKHKKITTLIILFITFTLVYFILFKKPTKIVNYEPAMEDAFLKYIREEMFPPEEYSKIYKMYEAHKVFEVRKRLNRYYVYMYYAYEIYYSQYHSRSSGSNPVVVKMKKNYNETYSVIKFKKPMDGEAYGDSLKSLFPKYIAEDILANSHIFIKDMLKNIKQIK